MGDGVQGAAGIVSGHVLTPWPSGGTRFYRDASIAWDGEGHITGFGEGSSAEYLLVPGLCDAHVHLPQYRVRGLFQDALLPWLRDHIWPEEERFASPEYRASVTAEFRGALIAAGTTSAMVYGAPDADSATAVLGGLDPLCVKGGDVLMDRNGPSTLLRSAAESSSHCRRLARSYGDRFVLTPRFVPTCSGELMAACGDLLAAQGLRLQTHLAENLDEVAWVRELHPEHRSYTFTYDAFGLLGPRSVLGHCIHLDDEDVALLARRGCWVAHCPTSNVALGSGRMPLERLIAAGLQIALATDVGAGPELSMLDVMRCCGEVHAGFVDLSPGELLRAATLQGARAMGEGDRRGALVEGRKADVVALRIPGGLARGEDGESALSRILSTYSGGYEEAVAGVWLSGDKVFTT